MKGRYTYSYIHFLQKKGKLGFGIVTPQKSEKITKRKGSGRSQSAGTGQIRCKVGSNRAGNLLKRAATMIVGERAATA
jgi:hypothetical protein